MITPTARAGMAAAARRYDAAVAAPTAPPPVSHVATDHAAEPTLPPAAYGANAAVSRTADEARGSLVDLLA